MKPTVALDIECYINFFLVGFRNVTTGNTRVFKAFGESSRLAAADIDMIRKIITTMRIFTFNGKNYDIPMLTYALSGAKCEQLKECSDSIIVGGLKFWHIEKKFKIKVPRDDDIDHVDLIDPAFGMASLKIYGGRIHSKKIQDLPFAPDRVLSEQDAADLEDYWGNDIATTIDLANALEPELHLREEMSKEYGIDLRSKSDAQIAEAIIKQGVEKLSGLTVTRPPPRRGDMFRYRIPAWVAFMSTELQVLLDDVRKTTFVIDQDGKVGMPALLEGRIVTIDGNGYRMGIGGLHSIEECAAHEADETCMLKDFDVTSYYPSIILNEGLYPAGLGSDFLTVYRTTYHERLKAKAEGRKREADTKKIVLNASYGKLGNKWSILYSPEMLIQVTLTGQLALLMLIELLSENTRVLSANTDGVVVKCTNESYPRVLASVNLWETITGFGTEETEYAQLYSANVNNYVAIKKDGSIKTKGRFQFDGLHKNPTNMVCTDAVINYLTLGIEPEHTVNACKDARRFITIRAVKGGAVTDQGEYLGKAVRWYYSTQDPLSCLRYASNGNLVANSTGSQPLMELCEGLPSDLDKSWYVNEAKSMLKLIGANA